MPFSIAQNTYAVRPSVNAFFLGLGGVEPYAYSVLPGGAGGSIDPSSGRYTAPAVSSSDPELFFDTIRVDDYDGSSLTARILVGDPLQLVMEMVQRLMGLANGRVYLYNQKVLQPTDSDLYIAVRVENSNTFGNVNRAVESGSGIDSSQSVNMIDTISFDLISKSTAALKRRSEFIRVFNSNYCLAQQNLNGFLIGRDPSRPFLMIPDLDGSAIPYRFRVSYWLQYAENNAAAAAFYDTVNDPSIITNP